MEPTVIVFSDVLVQLTRAGKPLGHGDGALIATLGTQGIALVICSEQTAGEVKRIQNVLGLAQPIICDGGETVVIPRGWGASGDLTRREERVISCLPFRHDDIDTAGRRVISSRYQRGVSIIVSLFGRTQAPIVTLGLTDPTRPDNLLPLVDSTIFVGADDGARGALQVADWVAAISDAAEQLRSARHRSSPVVPPWMGSPYPHIKPTAGPVASYRSSQGGARPH